MTPVDGPDFLCIGMPKAATGWFYDQLSHHPDFWMPPAKELHYLDRDIPKLKNSRRLLENWETMAARAERQEFPWGERERAFLEEVVSCAGQPRDIARYARLFRHKGDLLSGDTSPGYCIVDDEVIREIAAMLPQTRIVLLVRDPIDRVWSRICMAERDGKFDVSMLDDLPKFAKFIRTKRAIHEKSFASVIIRRWSSHYPPKGRFRVFLFDDIACRPAETLQEILAFVGADPSKAGSLPPDHNAKSNTRKMTMPEHIRDVLIEYLGDEVRACAAMLGGAASAWPSRYGL
jgi:hypothetical protein